MYNKKYIKETDMGKIIFLDVDGTLICLLYTSDAADD